VEANARSTVLLCLLDSNIHEKLEFQQKILISPCWIAMPILHLFVSFPFEFAVFLLYNWHYSINPSNSHKITNYSE